jgi:hypothetical protein
MIAGLIILLAPGIIWGWIWTLTIIINIIKDE